MLLIFDGDCGFCTTTAGWIEERLPDEVRVTPWQILDLDDYGLTEHQVQEAAWWVDDGGNLHRGHAAVARALIACGPRYAVLGRTLQLPPGSWIARPVYALVAKFRHRMPGATGACRIDLSSRGDAPGAPTPD